MGPERQTSIEWCADLPSYYSRYYSRFGYSFFPCGQTTTVVPRTQSTPQVENVHDPQRALNKRFDTLVLLMCSAAAVNRVVPCLRIHHWGVALPWC